MIEIESCRYSITNLHASKVNFIFHFYTSPFFCQEYAVLGSHYFWTLLKGQNDTRGGMGHDTLKYLLLESRTKSQTSVKGLNKNI